MGENISSGEYYRVQFNYFHDEDITYGGQNYKIDASKETLLDAIKWYYDHYKQYDVRVEVLRCKVERLPLEIKPVAILFNLKSEQNET